METLVKVSIILLAAFWVYLIVTSGSIIAIYALLPLSPFIAEILVDIIFRKK